MLVMTSGMVPSSIAFLPGVLSAISVSLSIRSMTQYLIAGDVILLLKLLHICFMSHANPLYRLFQLPGMQQKLIDSHFSQIDQPMTSPDSRVVVLVKIVFSQ